MAKQATNTPRVLDGRKEAAKLLLELKKDRARSSTTLATIIVGRRLDSILYVRQKQAAAARVGIKTVAVHLKAHSSQQRVINKIQQLNRRKDVTGILLQLPLPRRLPTEKIIRVIDQKKDADGLRPDSPVIAPFLLSMLHLAKLGKPKGNSAVILASPSPLRKRLIQILSKKGFLVTKNTRIASLIFSFRGHGQKLKAKDLKKGCVVIDGGIRIQDGKVVGDLSPSAYQKVKAYSPVPGGVGPLTVAYLIKNTLTLRKKRW